MAAVQFKDAAVDVNVPHENNVSMSNLEDHMKVADSSEYMRKNSEFRRGYFATVATLCLAIMGGAVLPVPWTFSITGMVAGILMCIVISWANVFTSDLLIRQCYKSGARDYEELAYAIGGTPWLVITQLSIVVLLLGSIISAMQQAAEAVVFAFQTIWGDSVPEWVLHADDTGYIILVAITFLVAFPLCMIKQLRSLEYVGVIGFIIVMVLTVAVAAQSIAKGLPAISNKEFKVWGFDSIDKISQAISLLGFAFYVQPLMMPLLAEMPGPPRVQARILSWAMRFVVIGFAGGVYVVIGFFGAAWYGESTEGNIVQNKLLGGGVPQGLLNIFVALYLAFGLPTLEFPTRMVLNNWAKSLAERVSPGLFQSQPGLFHVLNTSLILIPCLAIAMFWNSGSAKLLVITGATGVFMCSYICPVVNHFLLYFGLAKCQVEAADEHNSFKDGKEARSHYGGHVIPKLLEENAVPLGQALPPAGPFSTAEIGPPGVLTYRRENVDGAVDNFVELIHEILLPVLIVTVGTFTSAISLWAEFK